MKQVRLTNGFVNNPGSYTKQKRTYDYFQIDS